MAKPNTKVRFITAIAGIILAYPVIGNVLVFSGGAEKLINWKPQKLTMQWQSAWTLIPGYFHVQGLELNATTVRGNHFFLRVDSGSVSL